MKELYSKILYLSIMDIYINGIYENFLEKYIYILYLKLYPKI